MSRRCSRRRCACGSSRPTSCASGITVDARNFDVYGRLTARSDSFANPNTASTGGTDGNVIHYLYDVTGRLARVVDPVGRETRLMYGADGRLQDVEDWRQRKVTYRYDAQGRLDEVRLPLAKAAANVPPTYDHASEAQRPKIVYKYEPVSPAMDYTAFIDFAGNLQSITDPAEAAAGGAPRVTFVYDTTAAGTRDYVKQQRWGTGELASFTYAASQVTVKDALGQETQYQLADHAGLHIQTATQTAVSVVEFSTLPDKAPVTQASAEQSLTTTFEYGSSGELVHITYPDAQQENLTHFAEQQTGVPGLLVRSIAEAGGALHTTTFGYDLSRDGAHANLLSVTSAEQGDAGGTREAQTPSRTRLKTGSSDVDNGATIGEESIRNPNGQVIAQRVLAVAPSSDDAPTSGAATKETKYEYSPANDANLNARGRLAQITVAGEPVLRYKFSAAAAGGELTTVDDVRRGVTTEVETDANDRVVRREVRGGGVATVERFAYDASGRLSYSSRRQSGVDVVTSMTYDAVGRERRTTLENGASVMGIDQPLVSTTDYDLANRQITRSDPHAVAEASAARTVTKLDGLGRVAEIVRIPANSSVEAQAVRFGYDRRGTQSYMSDLAHTAVARQFDSQGREAASVDSAGAKVSNEWNAWGELVEQSTSGPGGALAAHSRNRMTSKGRLRARNDAIDEGGPARVTWLGWDNAQRSTSTRIGVASSLEAFPSGSTRTVEQRVDEQGRPVSVSSGEATGFSGPFVANGIFSRKTYGDYQGDLASTVIAEEPRAGTSVVTRSSFDGLGRVTTMSQGDTYTTVAAYDEAGNGTTVTQPGMHAVGRRYDARGLLLEETLQDGHSIRYAYDALGNLRERIDEAGEHTTYGVDDLGRIISASYGDGTTELTRYEVTTDLVHATKNRAGQWRSFVYDSRGLVSEVHSAEEPVAGNVATMLERRTYDFAGRLRRLVNRDGGVEYDDYDLLGRSHVTRALRYANGTGLSSAELRDVHTQAHEWNEFGERRRWRMPAAGASLPATEQSGPWRTWIDEEHDAAGNVTAMRTAFSRTAPSTTAIVTALGRSAGRLFDRSRAPLQSVYGYADAATTTNSIDRMTPAIPPVAGTSGLLGLVQTFRGATTVAAVGVERDATSRIRRITDPAFGQRTSTFRYDTRGRLESSLLAVRPEASLDAATETMTPADFRSARTAPSRLTAAQHSLLGAEAAVALDVGSWTATEAPTHRLDTRTTTLAGTPDVTTRYEFTGARRTKDGDWTLAYDEYDRLVSRTNAVLGRQITYVYGPNGRMIGRTAKKSDGPGGWALEDRSAVLAADGLPADVTFVWDPITDRLISAFAAGSSLPADATPAAGLLRQYVHGDQAYDDPLEVLIADGSAVKRYLPLVDEAGTGNITAVFDSNGALVERVLYGDAYGDQPRYLQGPAVEQMTLSASHSGANLSTVTVTVKLSDAIDATTIAAGVRLAVLNDAGSVVGTATTAPQLQDANTLRWTLPATEWQSLTSTSGAKTLEIAVTNQLRATNWSSTPVAPTPSWALKVFPGAASTSTLPVIQHESLATVQDYVGSATTAPRSLYEIPDLYLAASATSSTRLFTGFHAAPFVEPADGSSYFRARSYDPRTGNWLTSDPLGYVDSSNAYAFAGGDPVNERDPEGEDAYDDKYQSYVKWYSAQIDYLWQKRKALGEQIHRQRRVTSDTGMLEAEDRILATQMMTFGGTPDNAAMFFDAARAYGRTDTLAMSFEQIHAQVIDDEGVKNMGAAIVMALAPHLEHTEGFTLKRAWDDAKQFVGEVFEAYSESIFSSEVGAVGPRVTNTSRATRSRTRTASKRIPTTLDANGRWHDEEGRFTSFRWPPNRGFEDTPLRASLMPGSVIDRYGANTGTFVSPVGIPFPERALPPWAASKGPFGFRVLKPIEVDAGPAAPWFGQPGRGLQYELPASVDDLIASGQLVPVK